MAVDDGDSVLEEGKVDRNGFCVTPHNVRSLAEMGSVRLVLLGLASDALYCGQKRKAAGLNERWEADHSCVAVHS
eukprot:5426-Eustigmatos_ZCMA.PRE.1